MAYIYRFIDARVMWISQSLLTLASPYSRLSLHGVDDDEP